MITDITKVVASWEEFGFSDAAIKQMLISYILFMRDQMKRNKA